MRRLASGVGMLLLVGCGSDTGGDVKGPFSGEEHHYRVDRLTLPSTTALTNEFADDLDGDGGPDNQLGVIVATLTQTGDTNKHVDDIIRSGALFSLVEIQADSLDHDDSVGVDYNVGPSDGPSIGGRLSGGVFASNRTATAKVQDTATVLLPVFADADPLVVGLIGAEVDLTPDGANGYDGVMRGGIRIEAARSLAYAGVEQMMRTNPTAHLPFARVIDTNKDGMITQSELASSSLITSLLVDDIAIGDARVLSVGFGFHICDASAGDCALATPAAPCADRIKDGAETDIDCGGGTCSACAADLSCTVPADCQTGGCDAGKCRAPTCSDGFRDGFESDIDCGAQCGTCGAGKKCAVGADCASGHCNAPTASTGTCG